MLSDRDQVYVYPRLHWTIERMFSYHRVHGLVRQNHDQDRDEVRIATEDWKCNLAGVNQFEE